MDFVTWNVCKAVCFEVICEDDLACCFFDSYYVSLFLLYRITKITLNDAMSNSPGLRRDNRIRTIHASLAIENNSLSLHINMSK